MARVDPVPVPVGRLHEHALRRTWRITREISGAGRASPPPAVGIPEEVELVHTHDRRGPVCSSRRLGAISDRGMPVSEPPASPSVTMQYVTSMPASVSPATDAREAEVDVVGMRRHHQRPLDSGESIGSICCATLSP